jgi:argininosuccinate lyase
VARALGFDGVCENSLDAVSDRDFAIELAAACALLMAHVSRLCEEIVLWNCPAFAFVDITDSFCTGSSMMPQKKNPDVPELMRGKFGRVAGAHTALLALIKSQPLAYNKDNQEDKEPLFDALQTAKSCVALLPPLLAALRFKPENMRRLLEQGYPTATELADALVKRGMPFKDAHAAVSVLVRRAQAAGKPLQQTTLAQAQQVAPLATAQTLSAMRVEEALRRRNHIGGTAPARVLAQAKKRVAALTSAAKKRGGKA